MSRLIQLRSAIRNLDVEARRLIAEAAADGRFDEVGELNSLAKGIADFAELWECKMDQSPRRLGQSHALEIGAPQSETPVEDVGRTRVRHKKSDYPKFLREKDDLVKLGWSAKERGPYEHRVSKSVVDLVATVISKNGKSGHRFSMELILSSISRENVGQEIPSYQVYAAVSWMKWNGVLLQHGRQGYTIVRPQSFNDSLETAWKSLPKR